MTDDQLDPDQAPVAIAEATELEATATELEAEATTAPEPEADATTAPEPEADATTAPEPEADATTAPEPEADATTAPEPEAEATTAPGAEAEAEATTAPEPESAPSPAEVAAALPGPSGFSPAMMARRIAPSAAAAFGRVDADGVVFVTTAAGEREVGSYPGASPREALAYFGRKYDELKASADLLESRLAQTDLAAKDAADSLAKLKAATAEPSAVGDLDALNAQVERIDAALTERRATEDAARQEARTQARGERESLVAEAEAIAAQPEHSIQWKSSAARMRELFDAWQTAQKAGPRLDKTSEATLWKRFSAARNSFDRARRTHFSQLDQTHGDAKRAKERLVADAERLATSKDWAPTARAFKDLMGQWRDAGRAGRNDDDALWARFKAAQDSFFAAKDEVVAAEEADYRDNLAVKESLLADAQSILPVTDLERAKAALRVIQDKWDKAGKVPRADIERIEKGLRRIEQGVRDAEDRKWSRTNPEVAARASSMVTQLEAAVESLRADLAKAEAAGNAKKVTDAKAALEAREAWLASARAGLQEFGD